MQSNSYFRNFMIDVLDRLTHASACGEELEVAQDLVEELGGDALLVSGVDRATGTPNWARSTMREDFLKHYFAERFADTDPFIAHLKMSMEPILAVPGSLAKKHRVSPLSMRLKQSLHEAGYRALYGVIIPGRDPAERVITTFCTTKGPEIMSMERDGAEIRAALTLIGSFVSRPTSQEDNFAGPECRGQLSERECEVLQLLADGHRNDRIAGKLEISEVTVRKHLRSARRKLGAATRDQTLAIAARWGIVKL
ncbi:hypothetical protein FMN50_27150 [Rhodobacterales bacterium]|nr:hypothetical protein FMN50_27150 [Rhodobacterales bacterium]